MRCRGRVGVKVEGGIEQNLPLSYLTHSTHCHFLLCVVVSLLLLQYNVQSFISHAFTAL